MAEGPGPLDWNPLDVDLPRALLGTLAIVVLVALVVAAATSGSAFGAYNPAWDGASVLRGVGEDTDRTIVRNTTDYDDTVANETLAVVLTPDEPYGPADVARLRHFLDRGGTLVVAEDFGPQSNRLLAALGARARFNGTMVRDERTYYRSTALPRATGTSDHALMRGVEELTLNHGTVLEPNGARPIANTSGYAYLDRNGNAVLDDADTLDRFPVVTVESVGGGRVIAVSDPSLFINVMLERPGNRRFAANLVGSHAVLVLDYSHADALPPLVVAWLALQRSAPLQAGLLAALLAGILVWGRGWLDRWLDPDAPDEPAVDADALLTALRARHPDWDEARLERVAKGVLSARDNPETNE